MQRIAVRHWNWHNCAVSVTSVEQKKAVYGEGRSKPTLQVHKTLFTLLRHIRSFDERVSGY